MATSPLTAQRRLSAQRIIPGVLLIAFWWPVAWLQLRPLSDYYFFPLWFGFILLLDGVIELRTGTSLLTRGSGRFALLFAGSVPFWWIFEVINRWLDNWHYHTPVIYSPLVYVLLASIAFSTVMPAVLEMTELLASFGVGERFPKLPAWKPNRRTIIALHLLGWLMLVSVIAWPHYAFPLAWLSIFFIIEPINALLGQRSIASFVRDGNWAALWNIMLATVCTGFFWEMWNYWSMPKWTYSVPFVGSAHLFEMPLLGYTGYLPFGLEVFAIFGLLFYLVFRRPQAYARVNRHDHSPRAFDRGSQNCL